MYPAIAFGEEIEIVVAGSHPVESEMMSLVRSCTPHLLGSISIADRGRKRRPLVVPEYFSHDLNGSFVGYAELTARHSRNDLRIAERRFYDVALPPYENTAILTDESWTRGSDKEKPIEGYGSAILVMTRTADGWRVPADILGQEPPPPDAQQIRKDGAPAK